MSKAFGKVWHEGLLYKLKQNSINGKLLNLLKSCWANRNNRVLNGSESELGVVESGVPFLSILEKGIQFHISFFADDTSPFSIVIDPNTSALELNHVFDLISQWAYQWTMSFNPDPAKQAVQVVFSRKCKQIDYPKIYFSDIEVKTVNDHKHLGLRLHKQLLFVSHINEKKIES